MHGRTRDPVFRFGQRRTQAMAGADCTAVCRSVQEAVRAEAAEPGENRETAEGV